MTELWNASGSILEAMVRYAYGALAIVVLGFVVLEVVYLAGFVAFLLRWKTTARR